MKVERMDMGKFILRKVKKDQLVNNVKTAEMSFERYPSNKNKKVLKTKKNVLKKHKDWKDEKSN